MTTLRNLIETTPSFDDLFNALERLFPIMSEMEATEQDPRWHGEGNVRIHTQMVYEEMVANVDRFATTDDERVTLLLSAMLHDIAKCKTTRRREIDGVERVVSPRHADVGRSYLAYQLRSSGLSLPVIDHVLALVGHHHDWRRFIQTTYQPHDMLRFVDKVDTRLLVALEYCDISGRICEDKKEQLESIDLFAELANDVDKTATDTFVEELRGKLHDLAPETTDFVVAKSRYDFLRGKTFTADEAWSKSFSFRDDFSHFVVMCGPSGSGKSTYVREHYPGYQVVSLDAIRQELSGSMSDQKKNGEVRQISKQRLKALLAAHENVVWDATNLRRDFRRVPVDLGFDYGAFVELVVLQTQTEVCLAQDKDRERSVGSAIIERQIERAEFPYKDAAHRVRFLD